MAATAITQPREWDENGKPVESSPNTAWDEQGNPVSSPSNVPRGTLLGVGESIAFHLRQWFSSDNTPQDKEQEYGVGGSTFGSVEPSKMGNAVVNSRVLGVPTSFAYHNDRQIIDQLNSRGIKGADSPSEIGNDIKAGFQGSIFGLSYRNKMPDAIPNSIHDEFIKGLSQMVGDLPFYVMGGTLGGLAGSEVPYVGNLVGAGAGAFAVPAAIRKSLVLGIQKGDIQSFSDLMERTAESIWEGAKGAAVGVGTEVAGEFTVPMKFLGPNARPLAESMFRGLQQNAALTTLSAAMEGKMPTVDDFAVNGALLVALHYTVGQLGKEDSKASQDVSKVHEKIQNSYVVSGARPVDISAEALRRVQTEPTDNVLDRVNEITRQDEKPENEKAAPEPEKPTPSEKAELSSSTGIKNESVDAQREAAGLPPIESPVRSLDPNNWEQAKEDVDSGRISPLAIADSVNKLPRGLSPEETNALNYYRAQLSNQHKQAMDSIDKAREDDDPQAKAKARERLSQVEDNINTVDQATKKAGTEWGLTGAMRQRTVAEDYSLDRLVQRARVASPNGVIPDAVRNQLETLSSQLDVANKRLEDLQSRQAKREANETVDKLKRETEREGRKRVRSEKRVNLDDEFSGLVKEFDSLIMGRMSANPFFDPEVLGVLGKMAKNRVESGLTRIEDIVDYVHETLTNLGHEVSKRDIQDAITGYGKTIEMSKDAINVALREAKRQGRLLSALEDAQAGLAPLKSGLQRDAASERVQELQKQVRQAMRDSGIGVKSPISPEVALARYKKNLANRIADMERQLKTGDFNTQPQRKTSLDPEATEAKLKAERLRDEINQTIRKQELENRSGTEKAVDLLTKWRRAALLTSWRVLGKLQSAAMLRMGVTPVEELTGGVLSYIPGIDRISERAPSEGGGLNLSAEVKALSQFWQKATADDIWQELKTGKTSLDTLYGRKGSAPPSLLDFIGNLHGALKVLPKRAEFFRRVEKITQWAQDHNLDINDPRVQATIAGKAYDASLRAILMQDNAVTSAYNAFLSYLESKGATGIAAGFRFMLPIVKVPTNFAAESLAYTPGGLAYNTIQLFRLLTDEDKMGRSAMDNLTAHDMDNVMRGLKKGSIGLALMAVGFGLRNQITGYYRPGKRKAGDPDLGSAKVGNVTIPAWLAESPALAALQLGATMGHVSDHYNMKGVSGGLISGLAYGTAGIVKNTPFISEAADLERAARSPESLNVKAGELTGQLMIPLLASQIAVARDPKGYDRKAQSFTDAIKLQVPGLREQVGSAPRRRFTLKRSMR